MKTSNTTTDAPRRRLLDDLNIDRTGLGLIAVGLLFFIVAPFVGVVVTR